MAGGLIGWAAIVLEAATIAGGDGWQLAGGQRRTLPETKTLAGTEGEYGRAKGEQWVCIRTGGVCGRGQ